MNYVEKEDNIHILEKYTSRYPKTLFMSLWFPSLFRRTSSATTSGSGGGVRGGERQRRWDRGLPLRLAQCGARAAVGRALCTRARAQALATQEDAAWPVLSAAALRTGLWKGIERQPSLSDPLSRWFKSWIVIIISARRRPLFSIALPARFWALSVQRLLQASPDHRFIWRGIFQHYVFQLLTPWKDRFSKCNLTF